MTINKGVDIDVNATSVVVTAVDMKDRVVGLAL